MTGPSNPYAGGMLRPRLSRRLILSTAFVLGLAFALVPRAPEVHAQEPKPAPSAPTKAQAPSKTVTISDERKPEKKITVEIKAGESSSSEADDANKDKDSSDEGKKSSGPNIQIGKHGRVKVNGMGPDRDFDSFDQFVHDEPTIAGMVIAVVSVVFLSPVIAIGLILWYRIRKHRMLNETMLKLAEKGVVAPAEALNALAGGKQADVIATSAGPLYEQAKEIRKRAAWSDLRKGVIMGGIGLGLVLYSLLDERSPNGIGLVLLFLGIGYVVLWWFEERQLVPGGGTPGVNRSPGSSNGLPPSG